MIPSDRLPCLWLAFPLAVVSVCHMTSAIATSSCESSGGRLTEFSVCSIRSYLTLSFGFKSRVMVGTRSRTQFIGMPSPNCLVCTDEVRHRPCLYGNLSLYPCPSWPISLDQNLLSLVKRPIRFVFITKQLAIHQFKRSNFVQTLQKNISCEGLWSVAACGDTRYASKNSSNLCCTGLLLLLPSVPFY